MLRRRRLVALSLCAMRTPPTVGLFTASPQRWRRSSAHGPGDHAASSVRLLGTDMLMRASLASKRAAARSGGSVFCRCSPQHARPPVRGRSRTPHTARTLASPPPCCPLSLSSHVRAACRRPADANAADLQLSCRASRVRRAHLGEKRTRRRCSRAERSRALACTLEVSSPASLLSWAELRAGTGLHGIGPFVPGSAQGAKRRHQRRCAGRGEVRRRRRRRRSGAWRRGGTRTRRAWNAHLAAFSQQHEARGVRRQTRSRALSSAYAGAEAGLDRRPCS